MIGYFPTYSLGNVYAAQLFAAAERGVGPLEQMFASGDFATLREWLRLHVHRHGQRYTAAAIVERVAGAPPDAAAMIDNSALRYAGA